MPKTPIPEAQRPNSRDNFYCPSIHTLISTIISVLLTVLGTAWSFSLASKPQQTLKMPKIQSRENWTLGIEPSSKEKTVTAMQPRFADNLRTNLGDFQSKIRDTPPQNKFSSQQVRPSFESFSLAQVQSKAVAPCVCPLKSDSSKTGDRQNSIRLEHLAQTQSPTEKPTQPVPNTPQNPSQSNSKAQEIRLTLSDVVVLALENNRPLKNAYLERIVQRQELAVAEDKFAPDLTPVVSISLARFGTTQTTTDTDLGLGATVAVKVPTGGEFSFRWATNSQSSLGNGLNLDINDDPFGQNLQFNFKQPLLRGAGINVNKASVDIARLTERINILDLKSTLITTITESILAYRELIRAQERLKIAQLSLQRAEESLANNRVLIEAGRLAPVDIVQSETEVARRQVSLVEAENTLAATRLALLNILDIDKSTIIVATDPLVVSAVALNPTQLREVAFANQPDYLKAQLDLARTKLALLQAENNRLWDLSLNTSYGYISNDTTDLRVGLALSRTIGDLTIERDFQRSLVNQRQAENTLQEQQESLELQLIDRIRDVNLSFAQVELAKKVTASAQRQLDIAREKQRLGRDITIFELVRLQDELVQARNEELNALINYLNALTRLDQTLGTTLETWQVTLEQT
jgi:outer membrane protein TolC